MREQIAAKTAEMERIIKAYLPKEEGFEQTIYQAMNYSMLAGGKRLRPMLMLETYRLFGGTVKVVEPFMAAIEMIHTYSLIHDDLPALDNDVYRRGQLTSHKKFGEAMAILAGDALLNYAFEVASGAFAQYPDNSDVIGRAMMVLAKKPGVSGMIGGQVVDVELTGKPMSAEQMMYIYRCKTGALIEASMMIGAILAGANEVQTAQVERVAADVGLAFQIQDDILDIVSDSETLGKPVGSDERNHKYTYASVYGLEQAKQEVARLSEEAVLLLDELSGDHSFLRDLIGYLVNREK